VAPEGLGWFVAHVPISPAFATVVQGIAAFSAIAAMIGYRARPALAALTVSTFYLFALSQLSGAVWHDMHLVWMAALLAASPCDEAWAEAARGKPMPADSLRYAVPLTMARLLLGVVYVFPGLHKLMTSGLDWALSDNLQNQMYWKWAEHGATSPLRIDLVPWLLPAAGLFVLAFELTFPLLALLPRTRWLAALLGVAFHFGAGYVLSIPFVSLWACYVVLVDPHRVAALVRRLSKKRAPAAPDRARAPADRRLSAWPRLPLAVGGALVALAAVQGARGQMRSFPFACYPTFEWMAAREMPDLVIEVERADGRRVEVPHARSADGKRTQRQWGEVWSLAGVTGAVDPLRLRAYYEHELASKSSGDLRELRDAVRVSFYRVMVSVVPEERGARTSKELLVTVPAKTPAARGR
jgi:hypothetical protein